MEIPLRYLDVGGMLAISGALQGELRPAFLSIPQLKPLLPNVESAHATLLEARPAEAPRSDPAVEALTEATRETDLRHDHALRAVFYAHKALVEHLRAQETLDEEAVANAETSLGELLPAGLDGTRASYVAEEGNAARASQAAETNDAVKATLGAIHVTKKVSGRDLLAQWARLGASVGELERKKTAAVAAAEKAAEEAPDPRSTLFKARNGWTKIMATVLSVLEHATEPADAVASIRRSIVEPATKAAKRADEARRRAEKKKPAEAPKDG